MSDCSVSDNRNWVSFPIPAFHSLCDDPQLRMSKVARVCRTWRNHIQQFAPLFDRYCRETMIRERNDVPLRLESHYWLHLWYRSLLERFAVAPECPPSTSSDLLKEVRRFDAWLPKLERAIYPLGGWPVLVRENEDALASVANMNRVEKSRIRVCHAIWRLGVSVPWAQRPEVLHTILIERKQSPLVLSFDCSLSSYFDYQDRDSRSLRCWLESEFEQRGLVRPSPIHFRGMGEPLGAVANVWSRPRSMRRYQDAQIANLVCQLSRRRSELESWDAALDSIWRLIVFSRVTQYGATVSSERDLDHPLGLAHFLIDREWYSSEAIPTYREQARSFSIVVKLLIERMRSDHDEKGFALMFNPLLDLEYLDDLINLFDKLSPEPADTASESAELPGAASAVAATAPAASPQPPPAAVASSSQHPPPPASLPDFILGLFRNFLER